MGGSFYGYEDKARPSKPSEMEGQTTTLLKKEYEERIDLLDKIDYAVATYMPGALVHGSIAAYHRMNIKENWTFGDVDIIKSGKLKWWFHYQANKTCSSLGGIYHSLTIEPSTDFLRRVRAGGRCYLPDAKFATLFGRYGYSIMNFALLNEKPASIVQQMQIPFRLAYIPSSSKQWIVADGTDDLLLSRCIPNEIWSPMPSYIQRKFTSRGFKCVSPLSKK